MALTLEEAAEIAGLSVKDFIEWTQTMHGPDYIISEDDEEVHGIYTDSDGGAISVKGFSEIFEEKGVTISMVDDINYCDIEVDSFIKMLKAINKTTKHLYSII